MLLSTEQTLVYILSDYNRVYYILMMETDISIYINAYFE